MEDRIKKLRDHENLSQAAFGRRIGVSRDVINNIEHDRAEIRDYMVKLICDEYSVNEEWLRTGTGEMYKQPETFCLDDFVAEHGATELEISIMRAYFSMDKDLREQVLRHFTACLSGGKEEDTAEVAGVESAEAAYEKTLSSLRSTGFIASNTTDDGRKKEA